ncbi:hypothetical protein EDEG_01451 [Edhazardia aedis USNM 41457]|uniref:V-type proton ATPase subunit a n=1 Tax=Edhazardia aedis (strain USNM 41457) TaxID=1003232 RepID=J9D9U4_EDHAE|nr:hypothetical protein EDEG_01451 [Edhazardia aedis USNM 41457]|eukprot:EJW04279.1 hypothetical protein EDEG_01451 [Edhazardia aedis USNM 41457]
MLRSEDMNLLLFYFSKDTAKQAIYSIGNERIVQFLDLQRTKRTDELLFSKNIREIEKVMSRLNFLHQETADMKCLAVKNVKSSFHEHELSSAFRNKNSKYENTRLNISEIEKSKMKNTNFNVDNLENDKYNTDEAEMANNKCLSLSKGDLVFDTNFECLKSKSFCEKNFESNNNEVESYSSHSSLTGSFDDNSKEIKMHYERLIHLKDIKKDTVNRIKLLIEDLYILEYLDYCLNLSSSPENIDECKINLDFVCFAIDKEKSAALEKVLSNVLKRNIILYKKTQSLDCTEGDVNFDKLESKIVYDALSTFSLGAVTIFVIFTHGINAIQKIKHIANSLGGRVVDDYFIKQGSSHVSTMLKQVYLVFENNERTLENEKILVKSKIEKWMIEMNRELKIYRTLNSFLSHDNLECLVGQGWVLDSEMKKLRSLVKFINKKYGYVSYEIVKKYGSGCEDSDKHENAGAFAELRRNSTCNDENVVCEVNIDIENKFEPDVENCKTFQQQNNVCTGHNFFLDEEKNCKKDKTNAATQGTNLHGQSGEENTESPRYIDKMELDSSQLDCISPKKLGFKTNTAAKNKTKKTVIEIPENEMSAIEKPQMPPSYFRTNKITSSFQDLCNVYGIPSYKEINPAAFYITTFPFMFGAMFGDVAHGLMLLALSLFLIKKEKKIKVSETFQMIFAGRYIMLICSIWSIFFGLVYSDFACLAIPLFKSKYSVEDNTTKTIQGYTYPFGIDHSWHHSALTGAQFINSLKMKLSIILGFFHMSIGILISYCNARYKNDKTKIYCVIVPQSLAFFSFVGYLTFLIYYKWLTGIDISIITVIVNMFTSPYTVEKEMFPYQKNVQLFLLSIIVISMPWMLLSKPILETTKMRKKYKNKKKYLKLQTTPRRAQIRTQFLGKKIKDHHILSSNLNNIHNLKNQPDIEQKILKGYKKSQSPVSEKSQDENTNIIENHRYNKVHSNKNSQNTNINDKITSPVIQDKKIIRKELVIKEEEEEPSNIVDIWMHQCIETIEFGIGLISNTSSYLRLWAISLAHSQLTSVLHSMTLTSKIDGIFGILKKLLGVSLYAGATVCILICLEGLSSCLHALRLNWIEFNSKFYHGSGYSFEPLNFDLEKE